MGSHPAASAQGHELPLCRFLSRQPPSPWWRPGTARMLTVPALPAAGIPDSVALFGDSCPYRASFLSHPTQPSLNHIPGRNLISPAPLCCFPTKSRESDCFMEAVARPQGNCFALYCLKSRRPGELLSSSDSTAGSTEVQNLPLDGSNVDSGLGKSLDCL